MEDIRDRLFNEHPSFMLGLSTEYNDHAKKVIINLLSEYITPEDLNGEYECISFGLLLNDGVKRLFVLFDVSPPDPIAYEQSYMYDNRHYTQYHMHHEILSPKSFYEIMARVYNAFVNNPLDAFHIPEY